MIFFTSLLSACNVSNKETDVMEEKLVKVKKGLVIRGGTCSRTAFIAGAESSSDNGNDITNLSVNCTTDTNDKADYVNYLTGIGGYAHYCVAKWPSLEVANVKIVKNPIRGANPNPTHCLISGKTKSIVNKLTRY